MTAMGIPGPEWVEVADFDRSPGQGVRNASLSIGYACGALTGCPSRIKAWGSSAGVRLADFVNYEKILWTTDHGSHDAELSRCATLQE